MSANDLMICITRVVDNVLFDWCLSMGVERVYGSVEGRVGREPRDREKGQNKREERDRKNMQKLGVSGRRYSRYR